MPPAIKVPPTCSCANSPTLVPSNSSLIKPFDTIATLPVTTRIPGLSVPALVMSPRIKPLPESCPAASRNTSGVFMTPLLNSNVPCITSNEPVSETVNVPPATVTELPGASGPPSTTLCADKLAPSATDRLLPELWVPTVNPVCTCHVELLPVTTTTLLLPSGSPSPTESVPATAVAPLLITTLLPLPKSPR